MNAVSQLVTRGDALGSIVGADEDRCQTFHLIYIKDRLLHSCFHFPSV
jgi:hypothetical protein